MVMPKCQELCKDVQEELMKEMAKDSQEHSEEPRPRLSQFMKASFPTASFTFDFMETMGSPLSVLWCKEMSYDLVLGPLKDPVRVTEKVPSDAKCARLLMETHHAYPCLSR